MVLNVIPLTGALNLFWYERPRKKNLDRRQSRSSLFERALPNNPKELVKTLKTLPHCHIAFNLLLFETVCCRYYQLNVMTVVGNDSMRQFAPDTYFLPFMTMDVSSTTSM